MRRRGQASLVAAMFVLVALMIVAAGFSLLVSSQVAYMQASQQAFQQDQMRRAESLAITGYVYNGTAYVLFMRDNSPFPSYVLRAYVYNSTYFEMAPVGEALEPGSAANVSLFVPPVESPTFALVTALGNVFTYRPAPPLPVAAYYSGEIWGGDVYSYAGGGSLSEVSSGELFFYNSSTASGTRPWRVSESGTNVLLTTNDARKELELYAYTYYYYPGGYHYQTQYPAATIWAPFVNGKTSKTAVVFMYAEFAPTYTATFANYYQNELYYPYYSSIMLGLNETGGASSYGEFLLTGNYYNASTLAIASGPQPYGGLRYNDSMVWFSPYSYHALELVVDSKSSSNTRYYAYLDGTLRSYASQTGSSSYSGVYITAYWYSSPDPWYIVTVSAYTSNTITVEDVPAGWAVKLIGVDAIGQRVYLEAINPSPSPGNVTLSIAGYYAPIEGELVVSPYP